MISEIDFVTDDTRRSRCSWRYRAIAPGARNSSPANRSKRLFTPAPAAERIYWRARLPKCCKKKS